MKIVKIYILLIVTSLTLFSRANAMEFTPQVLINNPRDTTKWNGFDFTDSVFNGVNIKIVLPKTPNKHRDWIWRALFWGHEPQTDIALLNQGFHVAYVEVSTLYGNEKAIQIWDDFYKMMITKYHLNSKVVLEGMSRGGLIVFNWADRNADKVACIYADAPVCDIKSWPGGKGKGEGAPEEWQDCLAKYGLSEQEAINFRGNPIDHVKNIAKFKVPILSVVGDLDKAVPVSENTAILEQRLMEAGWKMTIMHKPDGGHHPHSFKDPTPIVDFILENTNDKANVLKKDLKVQTTTLAPIFQSHMVLQAGQPINIWGIASPEAQFDVNFGNTIQKAIADKNGNWKVTFPSIKPSFTPFQLKVNDIVLEDILIGELWICSGQSNMGSNLGGADGGKAIYKTSNPNALRLLKYTGLPLISKQGYTEAELKQSNTVDFFKGEWTINNQESAEQFSSVAWMFGNKLFEELNVPIGLIQMALGGSAINSWISPQSLKAYPDLATYFTKDWLTNEDVSSENRDRGKEALQNYLPQKGEPYLVGKTPYRWLCEPGFLFEAGIEPLKNLNFKGVIWYQGEADAVSLNFISRYKKQFPLMVQDWRTFFNQGNFPFIYVQLPSYQEPLWTEFREVQRKALKQIPNSFMAVTFDLGDEKDIHPKDKLPVGERMSFLALNHVYKTPNKKPSFPEVESIKRKKNGLIIRLNQAMSSKIMEELPGFEMAAQDGKFFAVKAISISKTEISLETPIKPKSIRYGWVSNFKPLAKIFNKDGLPLGAFVSDIK